MLNYYPRIYYKVNNFDYIKAIDISLFFTIRDYVKNYSGIIIRPYFIRDGEPPDYVSYKLYETSKYEYILLALNDIRNVYEEWPLSQRAFNDYIEAKYGSFSAATSTSHSYYTSEGIQISEAAWNELADSDKYLKSFLQYEVELNDKKSKIKAIPPELALKFDTDLQLIVKQIESTRTVI